MAKRINAAARLHEILSKAARQADKLTTVDVWASVLDIKEENPRERAVKVTERLFLMDEELRTLAEQMRQSNLTEAQYKADLNRIAECMNPLTLAAQWNGPRSHLSERTIYALGLWSEILPDEEDEIDATELVELLTAIEKLEGSLSDAAIPDNLRDLIRRHLEDIRSAISRYKIVGARALRKAANDAVVDIVRHKEEFASHAKVDQVGKFGAIVQRVGTLADTVTKVGKAIEAGKHVVKMIVDVMSSGSPPPGVS